MHTSLCLAAAGVSAYLGMDVGIISQGFQSFDGLVEALGGALHCSTKDKQSSNLLLKH